MLEVLIHDSRITGALAGFADTLRLCTKAGRDYFACFPVDHFELRDGGAYAQHGESACAVLSLSVQYGLFAGERGKSNAAISGHTGLVAGTGAAAVRINCNDAEIDRDRSRRERHCRSLLFYFSILYAVSVHSNSGGCDFSSKKVSAKRFFITTP